MVKRIGRYEVQAELGRGGFGQVFRAYDPVVGRSVAIKTLNAEGDADLLTRFRNEAGATGKLRHPNIIVVYDFGEQDGSPYLVMELLEGEDLERIHASGRRLKLLQSVFIMSQVGSGLQHAHANGIVHRDVKPANIMLLSNGTVKIMDFGIALLTQATEARLTAEGSLVGTFPYMAPEQFYGTASDALTDIFAYGVTFYKLLTGTHPFHAAEMASVMFNIVNKAPTPLRQLNPECPEALEEAVLKTLAKDRDSRYQSLDDVLFDLEPIVVELRKERTTELIAEARERMTANQFEEAQGVVRQVLEIDPSNRTARELRERLQREIRERNLRPRIAALVDQGREQLRARRYDEAIQRFESALRLDQSSPEVHALLEETRAAWERAQRSERLAREAQRAFSAGDLTAAHKSITDALSMAPDDQSARGLLEVIRSQIETRNREQRLSEVLGQAKGLILLQNFDESIRMLNALEPEYPDSSELQQLLARALQERAALARTQRLQSAVQETKDLLKDRRFSDALDKIASCIEEFPESSELRELGSYANEELKSQRQAEAIARVTAEVKNLFASAHLDQAIEQIRSVLSEYPTASALRELLQTTLSAKAERERSSTLEATLNDVRSRIAAGRFSEALDKIEAFTRAYGEAAILESLRRSAEDGLDKQRRIQAIRRLLQEGQGLIDEGRPSTASEVLHQATVDFPGDQNLTKLLDVARGKLLEQRQAEAVSKLIEEAENLARSGGLEDALERLETGLQQFPGNNRLARSKDAILAQRARQERDRLRREALDQVNHLNVNRRPQEAAAALERLLEEFGEDQETADLARAIEKTKAELEREQEIGRALQQGQTLLDEAEPALAVQGLREALSQYPDAPGLASLLSHAEDRQLAQQRGRDIQSLLTAAQQHLQRDEFEEAFNALESGLGKYPRQPELEDQRERTLAAKAAQERRQALSSAHHAILQTRDAGRLEDALEATRSAIERFGDELILAELRTKLQQELEKQQAVASAHKAILDLRRAGRFDEALNAARSAIQQFGNEPALTALHAELEQDVERTRAARAAEERRQALIAARDAIVGIREAGRLDEALQAARSALEQFGAEPVLAELRTELEQQLEEAQAREERRKALAAARDAIVATRDAGHLDDALKATNSALQKFGAEPSLTDLQTELEQQLEEVHAAKAAEERRQALIAARDAIVATRDAGRLDDALKAINSALQKFGNEPVLTELQAELQQQLEEVRAAKAAEERRQALIAARDAIVATRNAGRLDDALKAINSALQQFSNEPVLTELQAELQQQLEEARAAKAAEERRQAIAAARNSALQLRQAGRLEDALQSARSAIKQLGPESILVELQTDLEGELERRRRADRLQGAVQQIESLLAQGEIRGAGKLAQLAISELGREPALQRLLAEVDRAAEKERQEKEIQRTIKQARGLADALQFKQAYSLLDAAMDSYPDAASLLEASDQIRARQVRLESLARARELHAAGDLTQASETVALGLKQAPSDPEWLALKAQIERDLEKGRRAEAMRDAVQSAEAFHEQGRYAEGVAVLDAALRQLGPWEQATALRNSLQTELDLQARAAAKKRDLAELSALLVQVQTETNARKRKTLDQQGARIAQTHQGDNDFETLALDIRSRVQSFEPAPRPIPWKMISAVAAAVLVIAISVVFFLRPRRQSPATLIALRIQSDPPGATVHVGDRSCVTPLCTFDLSPGDYQLRASLSGYQDTRQSVTVQPGEQRSLVNLVLDPIPAAPLPPAGPKTGTLTVHTSAPRALVTIDNTPRGRTDQGGALAVSLDAAIHTVQVGKAGYETLPVQRVKVEQGSSQELSFQLKQLNARLELRGAPAGAIIRMNNAVLGTTGGDVFSASVTPGEQTVEIVQGGAARQIPQIFEAGQTITLDWPNVAPAPAAPPSKPAPVQTAEQQDWERVRTSSNRSDLSNFLNKYPGSSHASEISARLDDQTWNALNRSDPQALQSFLTQYSASPHRSEAQTLLDSLQQQKLAQQKELPKIEQPKAELPKVEQPKLEQPKTEPAQPPVQDAENRAIRAALDQFNAAFQDKQPRVLKKIWPSVPDATERAMRLPGTTYLMVLRPIRDPQIANDNASILCELTTTVTLRGQSTDKQRQVQVQLQKSAGSWSIVNPFGAVN